jgi:hypothetical protein
MALCLSFAGVAGCIAFEVGTAQELLQLAAAEGSEVKAYAGLSSGSVVATLLALECTPQVMEQHFTRFTQLFTAWHHLPVTHWFAHLRLLWQEIMPANAYQHLSGRLYIGYSAVTRRGLRPRVVSHYASNEEVMRAVEVSCHIMPYRCWPVQRYRGEWCCDGAFSASLLRPAGYRVVGVSAPMVHAHVFWSDWFPTLGLYKMTRLRASGVSFVSEHKPHFRALMRGEKPAALVFPRHFNPFRWLRRLCYLWCVYQCYRRWQDWIRRLVYWHFC